MIADADSAPTFLPGLSRNHREAGTSRLVPWVLEPSAGCHEIMKPHLQLLHLIDFSAAAGVALRTLACACAIEALAAVTRSLTLNCTACRKAKNERQPDRSEHRALPHHRQARRRRHGRSVSGNRQQPRPRMSRSRFCRSLSPPTPTAWPDSSAKPSCWPP